LGPGLISATVTDGRVFVVARVTADAYVLDAGATQWRGLGAADIEAFIDPVGLAGGRWLFATTGSPDRPTTAAAALDLTTGQWTGTADPPVVATSYLGAGADDRVLAMAGRWADETSAPSAMSWDPATDAWTVLPPPPLAHRVDAAVAWTGDELIVWGGLGPMGDHGSTLADGAAFRPDAGTVPSTLPTTEEAGGVDGPVVYAAPSDFGEEALAVGTVELAGQCLLLGGAPAGAGRPVIVWQFGTSWSDDESEVILPDGTAVPIGSAISAGGGSHSADQLNEFLSSPEALDRISNCVENDSTDNVFVIQSPVDVVS
jgi:hypothetical protein